MYIFCIFLIIAIYVAGSLVLIHENVYKKNPPEKSSVEEMFSDIGCFGWVIGGFLFLPAILFVFTLIFTYISNPHIIAVKQKDVLYFEPISLYRFREEKLYSLAMITDGAYGKEYGSHNLPENWIQSTDWCNYLSSDLSGLSAIDLDDKNLAFWNYKYSRIIGLNTLPNGMNYFGSIGTDIFPYIKEKAIKPIFFILYWNGYEVRGYIPKKGNNELSDNAYSSEDQEYLNSIRELDLDLILQDIQARITLKP